MTHKNIGVLLRDYRIKTPQDFHKLSPRKKPNFIAQLYTSLELEKERVLQQLKSLGGLKVHFEVNKRGRRGKFQEIPSNTFIKKLSFFANKTVLTFVFDEIYKNYKIHSDRSKENRDNSVIILGQIETRRTGYGGEVNKIVKDKAYYVSQDNFDEFLALLCEARPFLEKDIVNVIPVYHDSKRLKSTYLQKRYNLIPANFSIENLIEQFNEQDLPSFSSNVLVSNIYLPHFTAIPKKNIVKIRELEDNLYNIFENKIMEKLGFNERPTFDLKSKRSFKEFEKKLLQELQEIHHAVASLQKDYEAIREAYNKRNIYLLIGFVSIGLGVLFPAIVEEELLAVIGNVDLLQYVKSMFEYSKERRKMKDADFYVAWRVGHMRV